MAPTPCRLFRQQWRGQADLAAADCWSEGCRARVVARSGGISLPLGLSDALMRHGRRCKEGAIALLQLNQELINAASARAPMATATRSREPSAWRACCPRLAARCTPCATRHSRSLQASRPTRAVACWASWTRPFRRQRPSGHPRSFMGEDAPSLLAHTTEIASFERQVARERVKLGKVAAIATCARDALVGSWPTTRNWPPIGPCFEKACVSALASPEGAPVELDHPQRHTMCHHGH
jgi:hypothetical protein